MSSKNNKILEENINLPYSLLLVTSLKAAMYKYNCAMIFYKSTTTTTILWLSGLGPGQPGWASTRRYRSWIFWCKMKITQADAPTIWMECHPIQTNWRPPPLQSHHFYARCPSWHNPPNLSWLGTGTKYAGLHTQSNTLITNFRL